MLLIALKMLFGDRIKYLILLSTMILSSLLMTQQASVLCGVLRWATSILRNCPAKIWVVEPHVQQANEIRTMRDIELQKVRTVKSVKWAMPMMWGVIQARALDGEYFNVQLIGFDSSTLAGIPRKLVEGSYFDLFQPKTVIVDQLAIERLGYTNGRNAHIGDEFEINDLKAKIVGICKAERSFFNYPYVCTTYQHAREYLPKQRRMLSFILAEPKDGFTAEETARQISKETKLKAYTEDEFAWSTIWWFIKKTGVPIAFGTTVILGLIVGIAVTGQTFYSFVVDHLPHFGILKTMGVTNRTLFLMMLVQAFSVGLTGYGIGVGLAAIYGWTLYYRNFPPFFLPPELLVIVLVAILLICLFAVILGVRKISKLEPAEVFRS
jgi:putative ABC transport system permease protein